MEDIPIRPKTIAQLENVLKLIDEQLAQPREDIDPKKFEELTIQKDTFSKEVARLKREMFGSYKNF